MIRSLTLADTVRLGTLRHSEWVVRKGRLSEGAPQPPGALVKGLPCFSPAAFITDRLVEHRKGTIWIAADGGRITGLASSCRRSGPTAWEVKDLVAMPGEEERCVELLEALAAYAGEQGAERVFLRLPDEWRLIELARRSGFFPCTEVQVFTLTGRVALLGATPIQRYRERLPGDDHPLFQMYSATTPSEVRSASGLTLQQWSDAQEPEGRGSREVVVEQGGSIRIWVRLHARGQRVRVQTMIDPAWEGDPGDVAGFVLDQAGSQTVLWEVPTYQESLRLTLDRVGFQVCNSYQVMVNSLAVRVKEPATDPVSA